MRAISAAEAVSPAIQRTRDFLFRPFSWATYLKLSLVAIITEGIGSSFQSSTHHNHSGSSVPGYVPLHFSPQAIAAAVFALLLAFLFAGWLFYLITRLRFAYFHCLVHNTKQITPGWRFYRSPATRFFWFNLAVGICFFVVAAAVLIPFATGIWHVVQATPPGGQPHWPAIIALVLPLIPIIFILAISAIVADVVLRDCMLPHFALEDATAGEAWSSVWAHIRHEKRQFIAYTLLRLILPTIAIMATFVILMIPGLMLVAALGAAEYGVHASFANASGASSVVGILLEVFFGLIAFGFAVLAGICIGGPLSTGLREYALVFYGARYQPLGDILSPTPVSSTPPPLSA